MLLSKLIKILIVEDDVNLQRLTERFIKKAIDCKIHMASNGLEALTILLKDKIEFDLIILDIELPFLNGEELLRIIRYRPEFDDLPILVCSATGSSKTVMEIVKHKIDDFLIKPIDRVRLLEKVLPLLNKKTQA